MKFFSERVAGIVELHAFLGNSNVRNALPSAKSVLVQIYVPAPDEGWIREALAEIADAMPGAIVVGATTSGEIIGGGVETGMSSVSIAFFETASLHPLLISCQPDEETIVGEAVARHFMNAPDTLKGALLLSTAFNIDSNILLATIYNSAPGIPLFGGVAGDSARLDRTLIFSNAGIVQRGVIAVGLCGDLIEVKRETLTGWEPIGKKMTVTQSDGNTVRTIDHRPAFEVYSRYLGITSREELHLNAQEYPLIVERHGVKMARVPARVYEDGSIKFFARIETGESVMFGYGHVNGITDEARKTVRSFEDFAPEAFLLFSCSCRRLLLQEDIRLEIEQFENLAPTFGFFTYGEFCDQKEQSPLLNATMVAVGLREGPPKPRRTSGENYPAITSKDPLANRHARILSRMQNFLLTVSTELEEALRKTEKALTEANTKLAMVIASNPAVLYSLVPKDGGLAPAWISENIERVLGYTVEETLQPGWWVSHLHPEDRKRALSNSVELMKTLEIDQEYRFQKKDGTYIHIFDQKKAFPDENGRIIGISGVWIDISERKQAEERIHLLAFYDPLTELPNRRMLLDRMEHAVAAGMRRNTYGALLFIDLDNFKTINDAMGHDIGDRLLISASKRLLSCVRSVDTVARHGGDEFVILVEDLSDDPQISASLAESIGEEILEALGQPYLLNGNEIHNTGSIGITLFMGSEIQIEDIIKHADVAMYRSKISGRNTIRFFDPEMQASLEARLALEHDLRRAIARKQLKLYYQPQVDDAGRLFGAEGLIRWDHPRRGLLLPVQFIPLAEDIGLIEQIGRWVIEAACERIKTYATDPSFSHIIISINVSPRQFRQNDFIDLVRETLERTGANPNRLMFELTESLLLENIPDTIEKMSALRAIGIGFSLDDFGTGYSTFSYLKRLPLDQIKIDRSFVNDAVSDPNDAVIVETIVGIARNFGLNVVAEGVETDEQLRLLKRFGCRAFQGHLFGEPVPRSEFELLFEKSRG